MIFRNRRRKKMSVSKWAYDPDRCDGQPCPGDCDFCHLWQDGGDDEDEEREILAARKGEE